MERSEQQKQSAAERNTAREANSNIDTKNWSWLSNLDERNIETFGMKL